MEEGETFTLQAGFLGFHSCFPSLMPSSDESVTLQTDSSFKHSLAPAIRSHLILEPEEQHRCYGNEWETPRAKIQKGGIAVKRAEGNL